MDFHIDKIHFLDITLFSRNGSIQTILYRKPTSGNGILRAESCHPKHVVRNLPIGEYVRAKRSCSSMVDYTKETEVIDCRLKQRVYGTGLLNRAKRIVASKTRHDYLYTSNKHDPDIHDRPPTFVTTFSTNFQEVTDIVKRYLPILYQDPAPDTFLTNGIQCVARKVKSIGCVLSPSALPPSDSNSWIKFKGFFKCSQNRCNLCKYTLRN